MVPVETVIPSAASPGFTFQRWRRTPSGAAPSRNTSNGFTPAAKSWRRKRVTPLCPMSCSPKCWPKRRRSAECLRKVLNVQSKGNQVRPWRWRQRRHLGAVNGTIERVALDGHAACGADETLEFRARRELRSPCASVVVNFFFHHRAVQVVGAEAQSDLRDARRKHDPIRLDVVEIIEQQARHRNVAQVGVAAGLRNVRERRVFRVKRQWNEGHESVRFILKLAELEEMVNALFLGFHVAVKHGG